MQKLIRSFKPLPLPLAFALAAGLALAGGAQAGQDCVRGPGGKVATSKIVNFDFDSAMVREEHKDQLREVAQRFIGNPNLEICLLGMTDRVGNSDYNKKLAMRRAEAVADFLKSAGLKESGYQLVARGQAYSDDSWIGKLIGDEEKLSDRRVDVVFIQH